MMNDPNQDLSSDAQRYVIFEEVSAVLQANGAKLDQDVAQYLAPLLAAHQEFEQNRAMLLSMLQALES